MKPAAAWLCLLVLWASAMPAATLEVRSQPGVEVYWEGVLLDATDAEGLLVVEDVPEGPFELELRKPGFEPLTATVRVGGGTTRLERELAPSATGTPSIGGSSSEARSGEGADRSESGPGFRVGALGWLLLVAMLVLVGSLLLRSRWPQRRGARGTGKQAVRRRPSRARRVASREPGGTFLSELRQRERAMDDLVDVSAARRSSEPSEDEVVDVAWKEIE